MEQKICSFFGHRSVEKTEELCAITTIEILKAISLGYRIFYFGGFGDFDELCYKIVTKIKEESPDLEIKRVYCVPQEKDLRKPKVDRDKYEDIIYLMPSFEGWYKSIYYRNCAMIDASDSVIFYAEQRANSGAYKAYKYAQRKKVKHLSNLWGRDI